MKPRSFDRRVRRMVWETVSKAAERSRRMRRLVARISSTEKVISYFDENTPNDLVFSETRLKGFVEAVVGRVFLELDSHCSSQYLAQEWTIGYWTEVSGKINK